jgi:hypothetical protein
MMHSFLLVLEVPVLSRVLPVSHDPGVSLWTSRGD